MKFKPYTSSRSALSATTLILASLLYWACTKEFSIEGERFPRMPEISVEDVTIQGLVIDDAGKPVADALVETDMESTRTDRYGIFRLEQTPINLNGGLVTVKKDGFFNGSRSLFYETTSTNFMRIRLVKKVLAGQIAESGGVIQVGDANIEFPAGAFAIKGTNTTYQGQAKVYAAYLPANDLDILDEMPGNLFGIRSDSSFAGLETLGMMMVEIEGSAGQPLKMADGKEAKMDIPALPSAPAMVPMWNFDERSGFWKEEGFATKTGNRLVALVTHFSTWNWDLPYRVVKMKATFKTTEGTPLQNYRIIIKRTNVTDNTKLSVQAITDSTGTIYGPLPANEVVTLSVVGSCGEPIYSKSIGPVGVDTDFGGFDVSIPNYTWTTVTGRLIDCFDMPVKKGFFTLMAQNKVYRAALDSTGKFTLKFLNCSNITSGDATGYDAASNREGDIVSLNLSSGNVNAGDIKICGAVVQNQFINYKLDADQFILSSPTDSITAYYSGNNFKVSGSSRDNSKFIFFGCATDGSLGLKKLNNFTANTYRDFNTNNAELEITKWDANGWVEGKMKAIIIRYDSFQVVKNIQVDLDFRVRRQ
jgi:hypothetical protein